MNFIYHFFFLIYFLNDNVEWDHNFFHYILFLVGVEIYLNSSFICFKLLFVLYEKEIFFGPIKNNKILHAINCVIFNNKNGCRSFGLYSTFPLTRVTRWSGKIQWIHCILLKFKSNKLGIHSLSAPLHSPRIHLAELYVNSV